MIAMNEVNMQGELANKTDNRAISDKHRQGGLKCNLYNGASTIIPYPTIEVKDIWQVYVTVELKVKLVCFFTIRAMM